MARTLAVLVNRHAQRVSRRRLDELRGIARRALGERLQGDDGHALVAIADAWLAAAQVKDVGRATALLAPGFAQAAAV